MAARKQYLLRIDHAVWAEVEKWAADDLRSVNAQVEFILRDALRRRGRGRALDEGAAPSPAEPGDAEMGARDASGGGPDAG